MPQRSAQGGLRICEGICYAPQVWRKLTIDMTEGGGDDRPFLLWVHGGGWDKGDKDAMRSELEHFAARGWACGSINYRLSTEAVFPAPWEDVYLAARFVARSARRIVLVGASAGGHLVSLAGLATPPGHPPLPAGTIAGVVSLAGVNDLRFATLRSLGFPFRRCCEQLLGGSMDDPAIQRLAEQASPIVHVDAWRDRLADAPAVLLIHGAQDRGVPLALSEAMHERCVAAGLKSELHIIENCGHYVQHEARTRTLGLIEEFARAISGEGPRPGAQASGVSEA